MSDQQKLPAKKGENKSGLKSLFRRRPQSTNNRNAQPPQNSGQDRVSGPQMTILGQSGGISSEDDGEVGSSEIPRASTEGDIKTSRKQRFSKKFKLIWQGLHKLAQAIEPIVPEPFDTPFKLFNAISDAAEKCFNNEEELKAMMERLSSRLVEANRVLLRSGDYDIDVAGSSTKLAGLVVNEALEIYKIQHLSLTEKILGPDDVTQQINKCLDRLDQGTQEHHRTVTQAIARSVRQVLEYTLTEQLSYAPNALFNAPGKAGTSSRQACTPNTRENLLDPPRSLGAGSSRRWG
ncbi:hypothetical protein B0H14DRAFT_3128583 [Mycena olivaceomarginata]|nr:hypothetical protein B0H14DRAFT_3128583 [Mycena olivaceomarginata]